MESELLSSDIIAKKLASPNLIDPVSEFPPTYFDSPARPAAILMPLLRTKGEWHLFYIRRTEVPGDYHSGQVAFPGGARDPQDQNLQATALREANEEVGLVAENVKILGNLPDVHTISNYHVTPFVGDIRWPFNISISEDEVVRAFTIPLKWLADKNNFRFESRDIPGTSKPHPVIYYEKYEGELLWGLSARLTIVFLKTINLL
ncbi:MAG: CoA pyrophosphatase [Chloroflexota bacterium]